MKLAGLLLCNVFWSATYAVAKRLMDQLHPMEIAFVRYLLAVLPLTVYCAVARRSKTSKRTLLAAWVADLSRLDLRIVGVGMLTFFVTPISQMTGLSLSRAVDSALMIAIEPLATILLACVMLGERLRSTQGASLVLAVAGAFVLTDVTFAKLTEFSDGRLVGNSIFLVSLISEAMYSTLAKPALDRRPPVLFMTMSLWVGLACICAYNLLHDGTSRLSGLAPLVAQGSLQDWLGLAFLGWGGTMFGYLYWMWALQDTPVSIMAVTLYLQPVLGMLWGRLLVGEALTISTYAGGALILTAVWLGSRPPRRD